MKIIKILVITILIGGCIINAEQKEGSSSQNIVSLRPIIQISDEGDIPIQVAFTNQSKEVIKYDKFLQFRGLVIYYNGKALTRATWVPPPLTILELKPGETDINTYTLKTMYGDQLKAGNKYDVVIKGTQHKGSLGLTPLSVETCFILEVVEGNKNDKKQEKDSSDKSGSDNSEKPE